MSDPKVGEPLVIRGVSIPWDEEHQGWFIKFGRRRIGIERYDFRGGLSDCITYRYLRLEGGPWSMCDNIEFSIEAMLKELRTITASEKFMDLLLAVSPRHS